MASGSIDKRMVRRTFGQLKAAVPVPDLIDVQSRSFNDFVQLDFLPSERKLVGLEKVLRDIFPIEYEETMSLGYVGYELGNWACTCGKLTGITNRYEWTCSSCKKSDCSRLSADHACPACKKKTARYKVCALCSSRVTIQMGMSLEECRFGEQTFAMPLKIRMQLVTWDVAADGSRSIRDIKEQDVFFADLPIMADLYEENGRIKAGNQGTFLINGVDRVVVSQMHRSPGVVFSQSKKVKDVRGRPYCIARIIPARGSWIDFEFDSNDCLFVRIDKKKKVLVTTFLQALGIQRDEIIPLFYASSSIVVKKGAFFCKIDDSLVGKRLEKDMLPEGQAEQFVGRRLTKETIAQLNKLGIKDFVLLEKHLLRKSFAHDVFDPETGEILAEQGALFTQEQYEIFKNYDIEFRLVDSSGYVFRPTIAATLTFDQAQTQDEALAELNVKMWPGDTSSVKDILERLHGLFFSPRAYDLTRVGRIRMNRKLGLDIAEETTTLTREDIVATIAYLVKLRERGEGELDDIDHLGNRRVRLVGELLSNQVYIGFSRIDRIVRERFRIQDIHGAIMPQDLLNVKPLGAVLREFFGTGQLSQFVDQTNPLSELAHKRRLSALGPGGVMKDRATYEVRDVHTSHYGRICPIETPEGQTIGLISSLATYAMVNDLGFIESAYRPVQDGKIIDEVVFLDAFAEAQAFVAQTTAKDESNENILKDGDVLARQEGNFLYVDSKRVEYIDLSPKQLVSVAAALIPFLEHDDATRALMGANMQRQAVPLIRCEAPLVGTGMEKEVCKSLSTVSYARRSGVVEYVSSDKIVIRVDENEFESAEDWINGGIDIYRLKKFQRSSHSTWLHQAPIVRRGDRVKKGDVLTDGSASKGGELALGSNLLVAFMPWHGYNFEDAIVVSQRLVAEDVLSSVSLDEYSVEARDTKLGPEEITRDIPNVSEMALAGLDDDGIIRVGSRVKAGDILVGKVTLKGDVQYSPEEKLLRAIFGEKSREVRDTSLRVPPGIEGTVIDVKVFSRSGIRKDKRYKDIVAIESRKIDQAYSDHVALLERMTTDKLVALLDGQSAARGSKNYARAELLEMSFEELRSLRTKDKELNDSIERLLNTLDGQIKILASIKENDVAKLKKGDQLPSGVIKMIKVYVASKRHISVGDKMAGRHGNKGVVSTIVPMQDMPHLPNGTPVDIVLNPVGVPSRMNVGQILETILGLAGREAGAHVAQAIAQENERVVRERLNQYYGQQFMDLYEKQYGQEGVHELAQRTAQSGVHFETPVFEGASFEGEIQPLLRNLGLSETGAYRLIDGRTGDYFDQPVTVGAIYMMKLNHMVEDKLHARSVGPYSLVTQQPLGGKAQFGGQRFGEMEVWALEAYGAAYTLQELLTYKSDDVVGRNKVYSAIVKGASDDIPEPGLPESFNVLIKELQSLALQVDLFKSSREDVGE